jgi:hypothetical protein
MVIAQPIAFYDMVDFRVGKGTYPFSATDTAMFLEFTVALTLGLCRL